MGRMAEMAVDVRVISSTTEVKQLAEEAARHLDQKERVETQEGGEPHSTMQLYQFAWSPSHDRLVDQVIKDFVRSILIRLLLRYLIIFRPATS